MNKLEWPECLWCPGVLIAWDDTNGWFHLGREEHQMVTWCNPEMPTSDPGWPGHSATPKDGRLTVPEREGTQPL